MTAPDARPPRTAHELPPQPTAASAAVHEVTIHDGRFVSAECSCGGRSAARRHRATVRHEARDHALLYADGSALATEPAADGRDRPAQAGSTF